MTVREMLDEAIINLGGRATRQQIKEYILSKYPDTNESTVNTHITFCTVNNPGRLTHGRISKPQLCNTAIDILFEINKSEYEKYDPSKHGMWQILRNQEGKLVVAGPDSDKINDKSFEVDKMNNNTMIKLLEEFAAIADSWFTDERKEQLQSDYDFYQNFKKKENLEKIEWQDVKKLGDHIYAFKSIALTKEKALGRPNHPIEHYRNAFLYLIYGTDSLEERITNFFNNEDYSIKYFGVGACSELLGHLFPEYFVHYNARDKEAAEFLNINPGFKRDDNIVTRLLKFSNSLSELRDLYREKVGQKTSFPINIEIDQFFSYVYEKHIRAYSKFKELEKLINQSYPDWQGFEDQRFVEDEINYKKAIIQNAESTLSRETYKNLLASREYEEILTRLTSIAQKKNNLLYLATPKSGDLKLFYHWNLPRPEFCEAFYDLLFGEGESSDRIDRYIEFLHKYQLPPKWTLPTFFLFIYHPESDIFVKPSVFEWLLKLFGKKYESTPSSEQYREILDIAAGIQEYFKDKNPKDMVDVQSLIYVCARQKLGGSTETNESPDTASITYWAFSPGKDASEWDDFYNQGIMAIGWDGTQDFTSLDTKEKVRTELQRVYGEGQHMNNTLTCFDFAHTIKPGDFVIVKKGTSTVIGFGKVTSDYYFDSARPAFKHLRKVDWLKNGNWTLPEDMGKFALKTLTNITSDSSFVNRILKLIDDRTPEEDQNHVEILAERNAADNKNQVLEPYTKQQALLEIFLDEDELDEILDALKMKKNIILQGPPGVGKTYLARRIAYLMMGKKDSSKISMIQFHQSYSYEDFIQGYRPNEKSGFERKDSVFYEFCLKAQRDRDNKYFFIIDEINRGNLSKIFGELMMLIEHDKRGEEFAIRLTYSNPDETFYIPENVYIIGTMNTADRSLAMVDYALRRRFSFIDLHPGFNRTRFSEYLIEQKMPGSLVAELIRRLDNLNKKIAADQKNLGKGFCIGHSYFCPNGNCEEITFDEKWYRRIITNEIKPLLKEYWFDDDKKVEDEIAKLRDIISD